MKYHEFLDEFAKVAHEFRVTRVFTLRADNTCPITKVCNILKGTQFMSMEVEKAAEILDLDPVISQEIIAASDHHTPSDHYSARTRRDLTELIEKAKKIRGTKGK